MNTSPEIEFSEEKAEEALKKGYTDAEKLLNNEDKMSAFLLKLEKKLEAIPIAGDKLSYAPVMASLIISYVKKEYKDIPVGSIIAIVSALVYFVSPIDLIPDTIPVIGHIDDAAVILACYKLVESDLNDYKEWRNKK